MKKILHILTVAIGMAMVMPCPAQRISNMGAMPSLNKKSVAHDFRYFEVPGVKNMCQPVVPADYDMVTKNGITTFVKKQDKASMQKSLNAEDEGIAVKCIFDCNMQEWYPFKIIAYNKTTNIEANYDWMNNFVIFNLEPGTYDFIAVFSKVEQTSLLGVSYDAWVIKEDVEVLGETTLGFDPTTATNHIALRSYNPDGEPTHLLRVIYDENFNCDTLEESSIVEIFVENSIYHEDYGASYSYNTNLGFTEIEFNPDCPFMGQLKGEEWFGDIYVNDVSDKYMFQQLRVMLNEDELYSTVIRAKGSDTQMATNDYTKYVDPIQFKFVNSPSKEKYDEENEYGDYGMWYFSAYNKELPWEIYGLSTTSNQVHNIRFCPPSTVPEYDNLIDVGFMFFYSDACYTDTLDFGDGNIAIKNLPANVSSQNIFPKANGNELNYSAIHTLFDEHSYANGAEGLNFDYSNTDLVAGATCPIASTGYYEELNLDGSVIPYIGTVYQGQMGEWRTADNLDATLELKADNEVVAANAKELDNWMNSGESHDPAKLTLSMTNRNFKVDDIEGYNDMVFVVDQNKDDHYAPSLTALQFRAADGFVTNRFEHAEAGTMAIMCGDFNQQTDADDIWFEYGDCDVTVEYAPNGTDCFYPVAMTKDESKFHMPGYGAYYSASLAAFTEYSANGWYDLRITLKDAAGNYQQQVISPAVRIGSGATSVTDIKTNDATEVARYTIDGCAISAPQAGVNIVKMSNGTVKKVLVK